MANRYPHFQEEGLSLISTLWILTILSILATQLLYSIHIEQRTQRNFLDRAKYHYAARAGFEWMLAVLRTDQTPFDSLGESWSESIERQIEDGIQLGNLLNYRVTVTDEAAKVNVNTADVGLLTNLLILAGANPQDAATEELANRIVEGQPYRTVRDLAQVEGMTAQLLYGVQQQQTGTAGAGSSGDVSAQLETRPDTYEYQPQSQGLVALATIYSVDTNTDANGQPRVNINTAEAEQLTQIQGSNNQPVFTQGEAESLIQQRDFEKLAALVDVQAVSDELFNSIRERMTVEDTGGDTKPQDETNTQQGQGENRGNDDAAQEEGEQVNINTADVERLQSLEGIDQGIAERIVNHRESVGSFQNVDEIKEVKMLTQEEFRGIVDKVTLQDGDTRNGLININTASAQTLALLPEMDAEKAQAVVWRREESQSDVVHIDSLTQEEIKGNPFTEISQLLDIAEIDFETFREVVDWVTYRSHGFRIEATGVDLNDKVVSMCVGIIDRTGDQVAVQYWQQD